MMLIVVGELIGATFAEGVTLYTTFIGAFVVLVNVPEISEALVPAASPVIPVIAAGALQE